MLPIMLNFDYQLDWSTGLRKTCRKGGGKVVKKQGGQRMGSLVNGCLPHMTWSLMGNLVLSSTHGLVIDSWNDSNCPHLHKSKPVKMLSQISYRGRRSAPLDVESFSERKILTALFWRWHISSPCDSSAQICNASNLREHRTILPHGPSLWKSGFVMMLQW